MNKIKSSVAKSASELAEILGLTPAEGVDFELRASLNKKVIDAVKKHQLTHEQVAKLSGTSRSRITAILNHNTQDVSTDLMLRILFCLGYKAKISFSKSA